MNQKQLYMAGDAKPGELPAVCRLFGEAVSAIAAVAMTISALCVLAALALITWSVIVRYFLGQPSVWVDEVVGYLIIAIVMFGVASALREGKHIGVDILTERLSAGWQRAAQAWSMLTVLGLAGFLMVNGWETAMFSRTIGQVSQGHLELPLYWLQLLIPFGGLMLVLAALDALLRLACGGAAHVATADAEEH